MSMKQMEVSIMGQIYLLACPEGGDAVLAEAFGLSGGGATPTAPAPPAAVS